MPKIKGFKYLVLARDNLFGWIKKRLLREKEIKNVARFLFEDIICRFGLYGKLIINEDIKNKSLITKLTKRYDIHRIKISAYHPQTNLIKRGYKPIKDNLAKLTKVGKGNWLKNLYICF
jgi:hypothetical protein